MTLRTFSFGGGVQSMACLVLAARGEIDFKTFLFSNVGDDSENPGTLAYLDEHAHPFAARHGLDLRVLQRHSRAGEPETIYQRLVTPGSRRLPIPVRMGNTGAPGTRACTADFKIRVIAKWQRDHGATADDPAVAGLGISLDEFQRARTDSGFPYQRLEYPLIERRLTREDCKEIILSAGLPIPPKSSCWFCPLQRVGDWQWKRDHQPALFERAAQLEDLLNDRRDTLGKDHIFFSRRLKPLRDAFGKTALPVVGEEELDLCEGTHCFT